MINFNIAQTLVLNTFQKEFRNKSLWFLLLMSLAFIGLMNLGLMYFKDELIKEMPQIQAMGDKFIGIFFLGVNMWSIFLSTYLGAGAVRSDMGGPIIAQILSFPLNRFEYLFSRIFGTTFLVWAYMLLSLGIAMVTISITTESFQLSAAIIGAMFLAIIPIFSTVLLVSCISLYLPRIQSFILYMIFSLIHGVSWSSFVGVEMSKLFELDGVWGGIKLLIYTLFPRVPFWISLVNSIIIDTTLADVNYYMEIIHLIFTLSLWSFIAFFIFRRREV